MTLITFLRAWLESLRRDDTGAAMVEYGLLVALIAIVAIAGVTLVGPALADLFSEIADAL